MDTTNFNTYYISAKKLERFETQGFIIQSKNKLKLLLYLLKETPNNKFLIYTNTELVSEWLNYKLIYNDLNVLLFKPEDLDINKHSNSLLTKFNKHSILIVTNEMIPYLQFFNPHVIIHFDIPTSPKLYFLRLAIINTLEHKKKNYLFVCEDYSYYLQDINKCLDENLKIKCLEPDAQYLSYEDLAGSPFSDPLFMKDPMLITPNIHERKGNVVSDEKSIINIKFNSKNNLSKKRNSVQKTNQKQNNLKKQNIKTNINHYKQNKNNTNK